MFDFMRWRWLYLGISLAVILPGLISLLMFGLKPGIDFTGGSLLELRLASGMSLAPEQVKPATEGLFEVSSVQSTGPSQYILRGKSITNDQKNQVVSKLQAQVGPISELRFETVGPTLGRELLTKALVAAGLAATLITFYVAKQFRELRFGICAILAMFHDSLVLLGSFSLLGRFLQVEVDVLFVTALLTTLSFSVHDTIVVYDRIREFRRKQITASWREIMNAAVLQTLSRSLNNSLTIILMLLCLVLLGGETIRWFAVALLIGSITGTYSSTFTAVPLLLTWDEVVKRRKVQKQKTTR